MIIIANQFEEVAIMQSVRIMINNFWMVLRFIK